MRPDWWCDENYIRGGPYQLHTETACGFSQSPFDARLTRLSYGKHWIFKLAAAQDGPVLDVRSIVLAGRLESLQLHRLLLAGKGG